MFTRFKPMLIFLAFAITVLLVITNYHDGRMRPERTMKWELEQSVKHSFVGPGRSNTFDEFWKLQDSIEKAMNYKVNRLQAFGGQVQLASLGFREIEECDTCMFFSQDDYEKNKTSKYFLSLDGFRLKEHFHFIIDNGKYYAESRNLTRKEVGLRYSTNLENESSKTALLIPVSKGAASVLKIVLNILTILGFILALLILIVYPTQILYNISTGNPFLKSNIRKLNFIGFSIIIYYLVNAFLPLLFKPFIGSGTSQYFSYPLLTILLDSKLVLVVGLAVLLIARAFKEGWKLKQEQDLTV